MVTIAIGVLIVVLYDIYFLFFFFFFFIFAFSGWRASVLASDSLTVYKSFFSGQCGI